MHEAQPRRAEGAAGGLGRITPAGGEAISCPRCLRTWMQPSPWPQPRPVSSSSSGHP